MIEITIRPDTPVAIRLIAVIGLFLQLSIIAVVLRILARRFTRQKLNLSDHTIFLALFCVAGLAATQYVACISGGIGRPMKDLKSRKYINITIESLKFGWLMWACANTFVRLSMLHFIHTIFWASDFTRRATYILGTANVMFFIACIIDWAVICRPFNFYWRNDIEGICGNIQQSHLVVAIFNLILDFLLILLPLPCLWKLKMPLHRKFGVSIIFSMGAVICAITVVRIFTIREFAKPSSKKQWSSTIFPDAVLTSIEPSLGVINASIPLFPPVYRQLTGTIFWSRSSSVFSTIKRKLTSVGSSIDETQSGKTTKDNSWPTQGAFLKTDSSSQEKVCDQYSDVSRKPSDAESASSPDMYLNNQLAGMDMRGMGYPKPIAGPEQKKSRLGAHKSNRPQGIERGYHITDIDAGHGFELNPEIYANVRL